MPTETIEEWFCAHCHETVKKTESTNTPEGWVTVCAPCGCVGTPGEPAAGSKFCGNAIA